LIIGAPNASAAVFRIERREIIEFAKVGQSITASNHGKNPGRLIGKFRACCTHPTGVPLNRPERRLLIELTRRRSVRHGHWAL
jgi:hypothetical protein